MCVRDCDRPLSLGIPLIKTDTRSVFVIFIVKTRSNFVVL